MSILSGRIRLWSPRGSSKVGTLLLLVALGSLAFVGLRIFQVTYQFSGEQKEQAWLDMTSIFAGREMLNPVLPMPESPQTKNFEWQYHGQTYALEATLYDSFYTFYRDLPTGVPLMGESEQDRAWWTKLNALFLRPVEGDATVSDIARALGELGERNGLNENQRIELVAAFVQSIPYDQGKTNRREAGLDGVDEKTTYPYEVLYDQTGVCQDKSYLAYRLLQELGIGASIFLFPDPRDNHMAVGVRCPPEYANYNSGYCFLETTGTGNKIGIIPSLVSESRVATARIEISDVLHDQSENQYQTLGRVEILNEVAGKEYTGIIDTVKTRDRLSRLREDIYTYKRELEERRVMIAGEEKELAQYDVRVAKLKKEERIEEYNALVKPYNRLAKELKRHAEEYNDLVEKTNKAISRYNQESELFYE